MKFKEQTPESLEESAALYALDLLEGQEKRDFEKFLLGDPQRLHLVQDFRQASHLLLTELPLRAPAHGLKHRILRGIAPRSRAVSRRIQSDKILFFPKVFFQGVPWAMAACLVVISMLLYSRLQTIQRESRLSQVNLSLEQWTSARISPTESSPPSISQASASVAWNHALQKGKMTITKLFPCQTGQDYQLWVVCAVTGKVVSAGVVKVDNSGTAHMDVQLSDGVVRAGKFAISLERSGGSPTPQGQIVMTGAIL